MLSSERAQCAEGAPIGVDGQASANERAAGKEVCRPVGRLRLGLAVPIDARRDGDKFWAWLTRRGGEQLSVPLLRQAA